MLQHAVCICKTCGSKFVSIRKSVGRSRGKLFKRNTESPARFCTTCNYRAAAQRMETKLKPSKPTSVT